VAAWELAKMSRESMKEHVAFGGLDRDLVKINDHLDVYNNVIDLAIPGFLPRQWVTITAWKWSEDRKELTIVDDDTEHDDFPEGNEFERASATTMVKYETAADLGEIPQTRVTYTLQVDLAGRISKWVVNMRGVGFLM
jgi:hypothetical protein